MPHPEPNRIDRLIDIARGAAPVGPGDREHRAATRLPYQAEVALVQLTPEGRSTAPMILTCDNISSGGLCLLARQELSVGSRVAVLLMKSDGDSVVVGARVVYANALGGRGFECGLEFENHPAAIGLDDFQDELGSLPQITPARAA